MAFVSSHIIFYGAIHSLGNVIIFYLFANKYNFIVDMTLFIFHPSTGHLGLSHLPSAVSRAAVNMEVQVNLCRDGVLWGDAQKWDT